MIHSKNCTCIECEIKSSSTVNMTFDPEKVQKVYSPSDVESDLYQKWLDNGYFRAQPAPDKIPFSIVMPPPNITGQLHMGHALDNTLQDIITRWKRMQNFCALWLPGTDHASIATEAKVVEALSSEGYTKQDIGREKFLERTWKWKEYFGSKITSQLKQLGCSCDWSRERFTMDEGLSKAVNEFFIKLYNKGLIYRGEKIINWCPRCGTSISDAEVEYVPNKSYLWHIKYFIKDSDTFIVVATTRPETMLGDTAIAVNPNDERYKNLVGSTAILPLINREIPIISDNYVEKEFGTGAVKITPAHDPNDFDIGIRHNLPFINIMNKDATLNDNAKEYEGLDRYIARQRIVEDLKKQNLLVKEELYENNIGKCYRCSNIVEPTISNQWFVKMKPLAKPAIDAVKENKIKFVPDRFAKIYFNWMENIQDWCISRQLWWGHRIPAYYCIECGTIMVEDHLPQTCIKCGGTKIEQDQDTLDTWFSSALWPFSTLGWPKNTKDLEYFYPTNVLVTAYDIIFFWVARMIFAGIENMGKIPFEYVFIHGIIRDSEGRKMSKSLGNGIDPLDIIERYGTDSLRFALVIGIAAGHDSRFFTEKVESGRNFANKIWNASRFILMNIDGDIDFSKINLENLTTADKWILNKLNTLVLEVQNNMEKFEFGIALQKIYEFIWEEFCDWYIEMVKPRLYDKENASQLEAIFVLNYVMCTSMKLLHPYMPFITEKIYTNMISTDQSIMVSKWPIHCKSIDFAQSEFNMNIITNVIKSIRNIRTEINVPLGKKVKVIFVTSNNQNITLLQENQKLLERLASCTSIDIHINKDALSPEFMSSVISSIVQDIEIYIPINELLDIDKEIERLNKEKEDLEKELEFVGGKLNNPGFLAKAPEKVIKEFEEKLHTYQQMNYKVLERLSFLCKQKTSNIDA